MGTSNKAPKLNKAGITVRYLMYPRAGPGSETFIKSVSVCCTDDKKRALGIAKEGGVLVAKTCTTRCRNNSSWVKRLV